MSPEKIKKVNSYSSCRGHLAGICTVKTSALKQEVEVLQLDLSF